MFLWRNRKIRQIAYIWLLGKQWRIYRYQWDAGRLWDGIWVRKLNVLIQVN